MKSKLIPSICILLLISVFVFAACSKKNDGHTGIQIYVTDKDGHTVLGSDGKPLTEEWITDVVYATDENGETYTNSEGEIVTVRQTRPVITEIIQESMLSLDENGKPVKDAKGNYVKVPMSREAVRAVTDKNGKNVTVEVTQKNGEKVTDKEGEVVTEPVTEKYTELVTRVVEISPDELITKNIQTEITTVNKQKTTEYKEKTTAKRTTAVDPSAEPTTQKQIIAASQKWLKGYGGSDNDKVIDLVSIGSDGFAALILTSSMDGDFEGRSQSMASSYIVRFDQSGKKLWQCKLGEGYVNMYALCRLADGSFVSCGMASASTFKEDANENELSSAYVKVSSDGSLLWNKTLSGNGSDYFTSVAPTSDGGFVAGGKFSTTDGELSVLKMKSVDGVLVKFNSSGEVQWVNSVSGSKVESINSVSIDSEGFIYACGSSNSNDIGSGSKGGNDAFAARFTPDGQSLWVKLIGGSKNDVAEDIYAGSGGCVICGRYLSSDGSFSVNRGGYDAFTAFIGKDGKTKWVQTYGGLHNDNVYSISRTSFGYSLVGSSDSDNRDMEKLGSGAYDAFIMNIASDGSLEFIKSVGGSANDNFGAICKLSGSKYLIGGSTYSSDGEYANISPAASKDNSTAIIGLYDIY